MKKLSRNKWFILSILSLFVITSMVFLISCGGDDDGVVSDTVPPTPPANLRVVGISNTQITLEWDHSTDNVGVTEYNIFLDGILDATIPYVSTYDVTGLSPNTTYCFTVTASDAAGNVSGPSNQVCQATSGISPDAEIPSTPTGLSVNGGVIESHLTWNENPETDVIGYKIYRDGVLIKFLLVNMSLRNENHIELSPKSMITASSKIIYTDLGLMPNTFYCYRVKASDESGNDSGYSTSECATTSGSTTGDPPQPQEPNGPIGCYLVE
jgi:chitin-binding protein